MPVLGHAFVGVATGLAVPPRPGREASGATGDDALWLPAMVGLAYLPDIAAQAALLLGRADARIPTHSVLFAVLAAVPAAGLLGWRFGTPARRAFALALCSVLGHDALDLAQATDRAPWWPFSTRLVGLDTGLIPAEPLAEALLFGGLFAAFLAARLIRGRRRRGDERAGARRHGRWLDVSLTAVVLLAAGFTHHLRAIREGQLDAVRRLLEEHRPAEALPLLDEADRWPATARPGRTAYLRGEAHQQAGDRARAEREYLEALRDDPGYFWALADLTLLYASSPEAPVVRQRQVAPYLLRLQHEFPRHPALPGVVSRVERALAGPADDAPRR